MSKVLHLKEKTSIAQISVICFSMITKVLHKIRSFVWITNLLQHIRNKASMPFI